MDYLPPVRSLPSNAVPGFMPALPLMPTRGDSYWVDARRFSVNQKVSGL